MLCWLIMNCTRIENFDVRTVIFIFDISLQASQTSQTVFFCPKCVWSSSRVSGLSLNINFEFSVPARILDTAACAFRTCCRFLNISMLSSAVRRQLPTASLDERDAFQFRYLLGVKARDLGVAEAARK
eukprot:g15067.t1